MLGVFDVLLLGGELLRLNLILLQHRRVFLDLGVDRDVELALLTHLVQDLVLVGALRIFQSQISVALCESQLF